MAITESLPGGDTFLLDANARFYQAQPQGNAHVYVEKHAGRKNDVQPMLIGTGSDNRDAYLVKETNYNDIGGGLVTFERHFAVVPDEWFSYEQVTYVKQGRYDLFGANPQTVINPESINSGLSQFVEYTNTITTLAKATRRYYLEGNLTADVLQLETPGHIDPSGEVAISPDTVRVYMAGIYEVTSYILTV